MKIIINVGVSGSGKSTWTTEYIKKNPRTVRINRDDMRKTLKGTLEGYYDMERGLLNATEDLINKFEEYYLVQAYLKNFDVIIDNTNLKPTYISRWLTFIHYMCEGDTLPEILFKIFPESNVATLKKRVNVRDAPLGWDKLDYIDKQAASLPTIIRYIEVNHKNQILNE